MKKTIAIIGSGIIGLYLAREFSEKKFNVTVFEKNSRASVGEKSCSALVSKRFFDFFPEAEGFVENTIKRCFINFKNKKVELVYNPHHIAFNKKAFVDYLIKDLEKQGVSVIFEKEIINIPEGYDYVIVCDGANSLIRKKLGLKDPHFRVGLQLIVNEKNDHDFVETFKTKNGFCWIIPKKDHTEYGIIEDKRFVKEEWEGFNSKNGEIKFAPVPQGLILSDKVFMCGDATGLTKPWSGGGLIWQLHQARFLIESFPSIKKYNSRVRRFFVCKIVKGKLSVFVVGLFSFLLPRKIEYDNDFPNLKDSLFALIRKKW